jgi:hypothetical protein
MGEAIKKWATHSSPHGTVTFFIQTFFIRDKVYTNFFYIYGTEFIQGQSLNRDKDYIGQSLYEDKVYFGTKFIQ